MSSPYRKYSYYFRPYYRRYWQTHPEYRERQQILAKERRKRNRKAEIEKTRKYISSIYREWFVGKARSTFGRDIAFLAEQTAVEEILPREGFTDILWATSFKSKRAKSGNVSSFWMFDGFALKDGQRCAIQITTSPYRQIRNRVAVSAFLKFFGLNLYVCTVNPDLTVLFG